MRCLALAEYLGPAPAVSFLCRPAQGDLREAVQARQHRLHLIEATTEEEDAAATSAWVSREAPDWLVIDHYGLGERWEREVGRNARRILAFDDLPTRRHECHILVDQNAAPPDAERYGPLLPQSCRLLAGPRYAVLRREFHPLRAAARPREAFRRALVFFGGVDATNHTEQAIAAFQDPRLAGIQVDVVIGAANPLREQLRQRHAGRPLLRLMDSSADFAQRMVEADLAIGAGGTTLWERACLGLPSVVVPVVDNQDYSARFAADAGAALLLPREGFSPAVLADALVRLRQSPDALRGMSEKAFALTDGRGGARVAAAMAEKPVHLRRAGSEDAERLHAWRNTETVRRASSDSSPIDMATHVDWLQRTLAAPDRDLLVAEIQGRPMGVLRFDVTGSRATVSIYLAPEWIGKGYGRSVLVAGHEWLAKHRREVAEVHATILSENRASASAFTQAGYAAHDGRYIWKRTS
jgi:UDP-2,4-diacetamido-2,4,6-trideoxy-beta-L-altropyranose hydrolase